jgi:hypothetical protein
LQDRLPPLPLTTEGLDSTDFAARPIDLVAGLKLLGARWWFLVAGAVLGLALAVGILNLMTPKYTVAYKITPMSNGSSSLSGGMGGLGGLAAIAGVSIGQGNSGATPFELYVDILTSRAIAERLAGDRDVMRIAFASDWDQRTGAWREPSGAMHAIIQTAKTALGYPMQSWQPPAAADLQRYLERNIIVRRPGTRDPPITTISIEHRDPAFARHLLSQLNITADSLIRREALERATKYSAYLTKRLPLATIAEVRTYLAGALADQEKSIMIASSGASYAALVVQPAAASLRPTTPNYPLIAVLGLLAGLLAGGGIALYRGIPT